MNINLESPRCALRVENQVGYPYRTICAHLGRSALRDDTRRGLHRCALTGIERVSGWSAITGIFTLLRRQVGK